jgi:hypothetical protein
MLETREVPSAALPLSLGSLPSTAALQSSFTAASGLLTNALKNPNSQQGLALQIFQAFPQNGTSTGLLLDALTPHAAYETVLLSKDVGTMQSQEQIVINDCNTLNTDKTTLNKDLMNPNASTATIIKAADQVAADQQQLTADNNTAVNTFNQLMPQIQTTTNQIQAMTPKDEQILQLAKNSGKLNSTDTLQETYAFNQIVRADQNAVNDLNNATAIVNTTEADFSAAMGG